MTLREFANLLLAQPDEELAAELWDNVEPYGKPVITSYILRAKSTRTKIVAVHIQLNTSSDRP